MIEKQSLARHPARYTDALLPIFSEFIPTYSRGLDPFGGTGKIFEIEKYVGLAPAATDLIPGATIA